MNRLDYIRYVKTSDVCRVLGVTRHALYKRLENVHIRKRGFISVDDLSHAIAEPVIIPELVQDISAFGIVEPIISDFFNVSINELRGFSKRRIYTRPRFIAWYILSRISHVPIGTIASLYNRTYGAVIYGIDKVSDLMCYNKKYANNLRLLIENIKSLDK